MLYGWILFQDEVLINFHDAIVVTRKRKLANNILLPATLKFVLL